MTDKHTEFLRKDAIARVWCAPDMDHNYIFTLPRISAPSGALTQVTVGPVVLDLPDNFSRWQVFQIGGIPPSAFNLLTKELSWISAVEQAAERNTSMRLFNNQGICAGLADVFYRYSLSGNLIVALRMSSKVPFNWTSDTYNLALYSGSFWNTEDGTTNPTGFEVGAAFINTASDITAFNTKYNAAVAKAQGAFQISFWKNGIRVNKSGAGIEVGDSVWYELDGAIKKRFTFPIRGLETFDSTLDTIRKYLLHPPKDNNSTSIDFVDEVEVFITVDSAQNQSLRFSKLLPRHFRQLTHRDYSISVSALVYQAETLSALTGVTFDQMNIQLVIKEGGWPRPLVHEAAFIQELYKLDEFDIKRALTGIDATVPFWRAAALEASNYPAIMRADDVCDVSYAMVESAYGYYAMAKALAVTPSKVQSPGNNGFVTVPYLLLWGCTAYEYDENGLFLGWHQQPMGDKYFVKSDACRTVELVAGMGGRTLDEKHGVTTMQLRTDCNYRVYLRRIVGGQIQADFTDVTGSNRYTISADGTFTWLNPTTTDYVTVRSDRRFYSADYQVNLIEGRLAVNVSTMQTHNGMTAIDTMKIPLGQYDVMFNGRSLIRGLHYFFERGQIVITAREYIDQTPGAAQRVHVRAMGFCTKAGTLYPEGDWGFIQHGVLSNNNRFDIRDGRVTRVVVDGRLKSIEDFTFSEDSDQVAPIDPSNGKPYMVKDIFIPLKPFAEPDTWALIEKGRADTKIVSDYMTLKKPQPDRGPVQAIPNLHVVFSPFLAKILYDLLYGRAGLPNKDSFSRQDVIEFCKSYEPLLTTDPISRDIDSNFVAIVPHTKLTPIAVSPRQYQFLSQVVKFYADGKINLNRSLRISS